MSNTEQMALAMAVTLGITIPSSLSAPSWPPKARKTQQYYEETIHSVGSWETHGTQENVCRNSTPAVSTGENWNLTAKSLLSQTTLMQRRQKWSRDSSG